MGLPTEPVHLSVEQVDQLNHRLADMRHDVNNCLSLMIASLELLRHKPHLADRMLATLAAQPSKVTEAVRIFSAEFERALGISKP
jgi:hypothetical protein